MKAMVLLLAAFLVPGCAWDPPTDHATISNAGTTPVEVHVVFSFNGKIVREETRSLALDESFQFSLKHPRDGTYWLAAETKDGRSGDEKLHWQGRTGPKHVEFIIHDDHIETLHGL